MAATFALDMQVRLIGLNKIQGVEVYTCGTVADAKPSGN